MLFANINNRYMPINVYGYVTDHSPDEINPLNIYNTQNAQTIHKTQNIHLEQIQERYPANMDFGVKIPQTSNAFVEKNKKPTGIFKTEIKPINMSSVIEFCKNIGFNSKTERNTERLFRCASSVMKTKFTEETISKEKFYQIDVSLPISLPQSSKYNIYKSAYYEDISRKNRMLCLKSNNYHKCLKTISQYKQCYNKARHDVAAAQRKNTIICYTKTALHFSTNTKNKTTEDRDAYYNTCNYLIHNNVKEKIQKSFAKCNQLLTKNNMIDIHI